MRIAFYLNNLKSVSAITKIALSLEKEFRKLGYEVDYIVQKEPIEEKSEGRVYLLKGKSNLRRAMEVKEISENYDIVFGFMKPMSNVLALSRFLGNKKTLIGSIHNTGNFLKYGKRFYTPFRLLQKFLLESLDKVVVVSKAVKEDLRRTYWLSSERVRVIYNPIDIEDIRKLASESLEEKYKDIFEKPVLVNVGRLERQKGQWHLLRIFRLLVDAGEDVNLIILGDGNLRNFLIELSKDLGLERRVFFLGFKRNPYKFVKRSKVFVFTSLWEGFGNALVEAMALGIPFVASDVEGGYKEVIKGGGFYEKPEDYERFAERIRKLLHDEKLYRKKSEEAKSISEKFKPERIATQYVKLFEEVRNV